jgi:aminoglycoside 6'-N-acetyltransferase
MTRADLGTFRRWLQDPEVQRWFQEPDLSADGVEAKWGPRIDGATPHEQWFAIVDGREVAWFQIYALAAFPDYREVCTTVGVDPAGGGFDYLVGETGDRGRGIGSTVIGAFVEEVAFGQHPAWPLACASPHPDNAASLRALEKAGFRFGGLIDTATGPERLMVRVRRAGTGE